MTMPTPSTPRSPFPALLVSVLALALWPAQARAGDILVTTGLEAQQSTWTNDHAGAGTLKLGYQWQSWNAYFLSELGIASIDERVLQHLELGAEYWIPVASNFTFVRAGITHRHEAPGEAIDNDVGALLGYGDGIRHRAGMAAAVGLLVPIASHKKGDFFASAEVNGDVLVGAAGPLAYWGVGLGLGLTYDLGGGN